MKSLFAGQRTVKGDDKKKIGGKHDIILAPNKGLKDNNQARQTVEVDVDS